MDILSAVRERLAALGYEAVPEADWTLQFLMGKVEQQIKNECNTRGIPEGLNHVAADMVVGEFLLMKKATSPEALEGIDLETAVKSIREGDTDISFALGDGSLTPEQRLDILISYLLNSGSGQFAKYRRLVW